MKKLLCIILLISSVFLTSCSNETEEINYNNASQNDIDNSLIITEYVLGSSNAKAIEIFNPNSFDVNLEEYVLAIYKETHIVPTYEIKLEGILSSKDCYVVAYSSSPQQLLDKADQISSDLYFTGDDPIVILKNNKIVCTLGTISTLAIAYTSNTTMVKVDPSNLSDKTYVPSDWVEYNIDDFSYLGKVEHDVTKEDLEKGPGIMEEWLEIPFFPEGTLSTNIWSQSGTGGMVEVTVASYGDGDTTSFNYPQSFIDLGLNNYDNRLRYFGVDTPESGGSHTAAEPFGMTASNYVNNLLRNASVIQIQSLENYSINGTYGRLMGLVWIDGVLLQNEIIKAGYSEFTHASIPFSYNNLPITSYLKYNANVAQLNGKGIWGELDPLWDYSTNSPKSV